MRNDETEKKEELSSEYKNIDETYRRELINVKTAEMSHHDLGKLQKALDGAIMRFHGLKMKEINDTIVDLWNKTYQGTGIDKIMIKLDSEGKTTGSARLYDYRMRLFTAFFSPFFLDTIKMDMRGRCSAGQKVLASIIIHLALAESFSVNCGIMALDEPTTNLDHDNIQALATSLSECFQLIVITHDEGFLETLGGSGVLDKYWRVLRGDGGQVLTLERQRFTSNSLLFPLVVSLLTPPPGAPPASSTCSPAPPLLTRPSFASLPLELAEAIWDDLCLTGLPRRAASALSLVSKAWEPYWTRRAWRRVALSPARVRTIPSRGRWELVQELRYSWDGEGGVAGDAAWAVVVYALLPRTTDLVKLHVTASDSIRILTKVRFPSLPSLTTFLFYLDDARTLSLRHQHRHIFTLVRCIAQAAPLLSSIGLSHNPRSRWTLQPSPTPLLPHELPRLSPPLEVYELVLNAHLDPESICWGQGGDLAPLASAWGGFSWTSLRSLTAQWDIYNLQDVLPWVQGLTQLEEIELDLAGHEDWSDDVDTEIIPTLTSLISHPTARHIHIVHDQHDTYNLFTPSPPLLDNLLAAISPPLATLHFGLHLPTHTSSPLFPFLRSASPTFRYFSFTGTRSPDSLDFDDSEPRSPRVVLQRMNLPEWRVTLGDVELPAFLQ
ncbi:hypothetical protein JCM6882_009670 [Rhodosporidiobolus microsporus]